MSDKKKIYFGGGCFWCTEAVFSSLKGVIKVLPGYAGGTVSNPSYEQVCTGDTGHAEVVEVTYNSEIVALEDLLAVFFTTHDPTTVNRQGNDIGEQYRSIIMYDNANDKKVIRTFISKIENEHLFDRPVVTQVKPLQQFYEAEAYHHNYYDNNSEKRYCQAVINPKLKKFREHFAGLLVDA